MRTDLLLALMLSLAACGGAEKPATESTTTATPTEPTEPTVMTADECTAAGGTVKTDPGDGSGQCDAGFDEIGAVSGGIERSLCCKPTPDAAE